MVLDFDKDNACADAPMTDYEIGEAWGNIVGIAVVACVALGALAAVFL